VLYWIVAAIPAYLVCVRRQVPSPGLAFIPFVGPVIAILRSIGTTAWLTVLGVIPGIAFFFYLWLAFTVPARHARSTVWGIWFIIPLANLVGFYVYALTLPGQLMLSPE